MKSSVSFQIMLIAGGVTGALQCVTTGCKSQGVPESSVISASSATGSELPKIDPALRSAIGVLDLGDRKCNAVLITPSTITVAGKCVQGRMKQFSGFKFLALTGGVSKIAAAYSYDAGKDLVIYQLSRSLSGYLVPESEAKAQDEVRIAGLDQSSGQEFSVNCVVTERVPEYAAMIYQCESPLPADIPGAAVLKNGQLVGLHMGFYKSRAAYVGTEFGTMDSKQGIMNLDGFTHQAP